jgi:hypothetical protein
MATSANMLWSKVNPNTDEFQLLLDAGFVTKQGNYHHGLQQVHHPCQR